MTVQNKLYIMENWWDFIYLDYTIYHLYIRWLIDLKLLFI